MSKTNDEIFRRAAELYRVNTKEGRGHDEGGSDQQKMERQNKTALVMDFFETCRVQDASPENSLSELMNRVEGLVFESSSSDCSSSGSNQPSLETQVEDLVRNFVINKSSSANNTQQCSAQQRQEEVHRTFFEEDSDGGVEDTVLFSAYDQDDAERGGDQSHVNNEEGGEVLFFGDGDNDDDVNNNVMCFGDEGGGSFRDDESYHMADREEEEDPRKDSLLQDPLQLHRGDESYIDPTDVYVIVDDGKEGGRISDFMGVFSFLDTLANALESPTNTNNSTESPPPHLQRLIKDTIHVILSIGAADCLSTPSWRAILTILKFSLRNDGNFIESDGIGSSSPSIIRFLVELFEGAAGPQAIMLFRCFNDFLVNPLLQRTRGQSRGGEASVDEKNLKVIIKLHWRMLLELPSSWISISEEEVGSLASNVAKVIILAEEKHHSLYSECDPSAIWLDVWLRDFRSAVPIRKALANFDSDRKSDVSGQESTRSEESAALLEWASNSLGKHAMCEAIVDLLAV